MSADSIDGHVPAARLARLKQTSQYPDSAYRDRVVGSKL